MNEPGTISLAVEQIVVATFLDADLALAPQNIRVDYKYHAEYLAHQLRVSLHLPTYELEDRVVAEWPATWVQHIRKRLGLGYRRQHVRLRQVLVVPDIPAPLLGRAGLRKIVYLNGSALT